MAQIYCAGPLFNEPEMAEMAAIAATVRDAGHKTYLPQRDGLEAKELVKAIRAHSIDEESARDVHDHAIFSLDVYELLSRADAVVANLNGRVPDEGTVIECALAWHAGKPLVLYKNDGRAPFDGRDNPMVTGLVRGEVVHDLSEIPGRLEKVLGSDVSGIVERELELGRKVFELKGRETVQDLGAAIVRVVGAALFRTE